MSLLHHWSSKGDGIGVVRTGSKAQCERPSSMTTTLGNTAPSMIHFSKSAIWLFVSGFPVGGIAETSLSVCLIARNNRLAVTSWRSNAGPESPPNSRAASESRCRLPLLRLSCSEWHDQQRSARTKRILFSKKSVRSSANPDRQENAKTIPAKTAMRPVESCVEFMTRPQSLPRG